MVLPAKPGADLTPSRSMQMASTEQDVRLQHGLPLPLALLWPLTFFPILPFSIVLSAFIVPMDLSSDRAVILWLVLASALACALLIGFTQKLVLQSHINVGRRWVVATASGIGIVWLLA